MITRQQHDKVCMSYLRFRIHVDLGDLDQWEKGLGSSPIEIDGNKSIKKGKKK